ILPNILFQNRRSERAETFAILDLQVQLFLHLRISRIPQNASTSQSAGAELHAPLKPADYISLGDFRRHVGSEFGEILEVGCFGVILLQGAANFGIGELRSQVRSASRVPVPIQVPLVPFMDMPDSIGGPDGATGIPRRRLNPDVFEGPL